MSCLVLRFWVPPRLPTSRGGTELMRLGIQGNSPILRNNVQDLWVIPTNRGIDLGSDDHSLEDPTLSDCGHNGEGSTLLGNWGWPRGSGWEVKIWIETANRKLLHCGRSFKFFCERVERNYKATWPYLCYWSLSICPRKPGWSSFLLDCQEWCPNHTQRTVKVWPCFWPEQCCRAGDQPKDPVSSSYEMWICQVTRWWERLNTDVIDTHLAISWRWIIHDYLEWSKMRKVCVCVHQSNAHSVAIASIYDLECHFYILHLWSFVNTVSWGKRAIAAAAPAPTRTSIHHFPGSTEPPPEKTSACCTRLASSAGTLERATNSRTCTFVMYFTCEQGPQHLLVATLQRHQE